jgi:D-glycerate 3-kinase
LSGYYQDLFNKFDILLMIKVPSIEFVYESRWLQEQTLSKTLKDPLLLEKIMTKEEVFRFVMHYERLTHYILEEMPAFSDIVLERDKNFNFSYIKSP